MRTLIVAGALLLVASGCGRVDDGAGAPDGGVAEGSVDTAKADVVTVPGCRGAKDGPCLEEGKLCVYTDKCVVWSEFTTAVKCLRKTPGGPLEWVTTGGMECYRVNDPSGCPYGGGVDTEYCDKIGQLCEYPAACARYKVYQVAKCVAVDGGVGTWKTETMKPCGT